MKDTIMSFFFFFEVLATVGYYYYNIELLQGRTTGQITMSVSKDTLNEINYGNKY